MKIEIKQILGQLRRGEVPEGYKMVGRHLAPAEWKVMHMSDIYTERKEPGEETLPILTVSIHSGVSDGALDEEEIGKPVKRMEDKSQYKKAVSGDLVFNMMRAWQGAVGTVRTTGMVSPAYIVATPNNAVDPIFMDYYMKTPLMIHTMHSQSYGVTDFRLRLYWDSFTPIKGAFPSIEEQQRIAVILTAQDKVIELKEKLLAKKEKRHANFRFQLLSGRIRLSGYSVPWHRTQLGRIIKKENKKNKDFKYQYVFSNSAQHGIILQQEQFKKDIANTDRIDGYYISEPGMFAYNPRISKSAPCGPIRRNDLGKTGVMSPLYTLFSITDKDINSDFLDSYFRSNLWNSYMKSVANYGARHDRMAVSMEDFFGMPIPVPDLEEQKAIAEVLSTADRELDLLRQDIEAEQQKKKALMQLLLTGIVRVNHET